MRIVLEPGESLRVEVNDIGTSTVGTHTLKVGEIVQVERKNGTSDVSIKITNVKKLRKLVVLRNLYPPHNSFITSVGERNEKEITLCRGKVQYEVLATFDTIEECQDFLYGPGSHR